MTADEVRRHIHYSGWASRKVMETARQLSTDDLERANGISHGSIAGTLSHIYLADRVWYERITGSTTKVVWEATLAETQAAWPETQHKWQAWADERSDADVDRILHYQSFSGAAGAASYGQVVMHVVNHATLHRGQVVGMIRQLGVTPPVTDMMFYFRELAAEA